MLFPCKNIVRTSIYIIVLLLPVLILMSCSKLQSGVSSFSEKVKETFHIRKKATVTVSRLNLRKEPSTQSHALSVLRQGDELEVHRLSGKWAKVKTSDEKEGWVYVRYITGFEELFAEKQHTTETQKTTSIQRSESPIGEGGQFAFSHPEGLFSLQLPMGWDNNKENQDYFEKYLFNDPSQKMEIWVVYTSSEDYSEDEFYRDLASLLMELSGARTEISPSTRRKSDSGLEWVYGKVEIKSEPLRTHEYWIKEHDGRLWAIVEVYLQTVSKTAPKRLSAIRGSFSFGTKFDPQVPHNFKKDLGSSGPVYPAVAN